MLSVLYFTLHFLLIKYKLIELFPLNEYVNVHMNDISHPETATDNVLINEYCG